LRQRCVGWVVQLHGELALGSAGAIAAADVECPVVDEEAVSRDEAESVVVRVGDGRACHEADEVIAGIGGTETDA
jgi:hypothetical protein